MAGKKKKARKARKHARKHSKKKAHKKGHRKSPKRSRAAKKGARTRAEKKAKRSAAAKKGARKRKARKSHGKKKHHHGKKRRSHGKKKRRSHGKRKKSHGKKRKAKRSHKKSRKHAKKRSRKHAKRKAKRHGKSHKRGKRKVSADTRAYKKRRSYERNLARKVARRQKRDEKKSRTKRRKVAKKDKEIAKHERRIARLQAEKARLEKAAEARRHRRHHHHARAANPIGSSGWMEFLAGFFGAVVGGGIALVADRYSTTHALTTGSSGSGYADAPGSGQVYNSQGANTPIWSSWARMAWAAAAILTPLGISAAIPDKHPHAKSFFQIGFFGALTVTGVKALADGASALAGSTAFGARLFAPEAAATAQLGAQGQSSATQLPSVDLSQATNAAGNQTNAQAGQGSVFVAGARPGTRRLVGNTDSPLNAGPTGSYVPTTSPTSVSTSSRGGVMNAPPPPITPQPVAQPVLANTNGSGSSSSGGGANGDESDQPLPGNTQGPMCLNCAKPAHSGGCADDFDIFNPAGEAPSDTGMSDSQGNSEADTVN